MVVRLTPSLILPMLGSNYCSSLLSSFTELRVIEYTECVHNGIREFSAAPCNRGLLQVADRLFPKGYILNLLRSWEGLDGIENKYTL